MKYEAIKATIGELLRTNSTSTLLNEAVTPNGEPLVLVDLSIRLSDEADDSAGENIDAMMGEMLEKAEQDAEDNESESLMGESFKLLDLLALEELGAEVTVSYVPNATREDLTADMDFTIENVLEGVLMSMESAVESLFGDDVDPMEAFPYLVLGEKIETKTGFDYTGGDSEEFSKQMKIRADEKLAEFTHPIQSVEFSMFTHKDDENKYLITTKMSL